MSLPVLVPSPPTPSSSSNVSPSPDLHPHPNTRNSANAAARRKHNKRLNTAEHRAIHNAVERARRETLNGRFLDLAKLLPNLSQIRRPSKSAIVNSSIAHLAASRRHRALASRELRILKLESDHLRKELNEWRDRAGIARVEEPVRGEAFSMILNQEVEDIPVLKHGGGYDDEEFMDDASSEGDYTPNHSLDSDSHHSGSTTTPYMNPPPPLSTFMPNPQHPHRQQSLNTSPSPTYGGVHYEIQDTTSYTNAGFVVPSFNNMQMMVTAGRGMNAYPMMVQ
ncbi:hypothetical protein E1B28_013804 [Marasmius oreades]|uniref:BHLH domain-containing protein n=1 Tax=Marasmius oreades TaxID=181124 RepID=A0A9P7RQD1_9AGAR|nr:uncharacterized protein E1B28_013804 [Marasmius oreades]KAG7087866.1 hypothetical protein E1B28_013804 [Marasmius oreades]